MPQARAGNAAAARLLAAPKHSENVLGTAHAARATRNAGCTGRFGLSSGQAVRVRGVHRDRVHCLCRAAAINLLLVWVCGAARFMAAAPCWLGPGPWPTAAQHCKCTSTASQSFRNLSGPTYLLSSGPHHSPRRGGPRCRGPRRRGPGVVCLK